MLSDRTGRDTPLANSGDPSIPTAPGLTAGWFLAIVVLLAFGLEHYVVGHLTWLLPLSVAFVQWAAHPSIAGGLVLPAGTAKVGGDLVMVVGTAWLLTDILLARSIFARSWPCRAGMAVIMTVSLAGFVGMLSIVVGQVTTVFITGVQGTLVVTVGLIWVATRRRRRHVEPVNYSAGRAPANLAYRWLYIGAIVVAILSVILTMIHAALSPVVEWDATIYHAASARFWYMGRPNPPLMFGPSIGIEASYNYPPLFPAAGLITDIVGGGFHDLYLRLASPILMAGFFSLIFGYTRQRFGNAEASWSLLLACGSPLLILYGVWTTDYMLLTGLILATVVLADAAIQRSSLVGWAGAGGVAGLAVLTNLIGWLAFGIGLLALLVQSRPRRWVRAGAVFVLAALLVAGPWLLRNWLLLQDPVYPLAGGLFHVPSLTGVIFAASEAELKLSAVREWTGTRLPLRLAELATAVVNKNLLPIGVLPGVIYAGWRAWHKSLRFAWWGLCCLAIMAVLLIPGWYWIRYLLPLLCVALVLGGCTLVALAHDGPSLFVRPGRRSSPLRFVVPVILVLTAVTSGAVGVGLSLAGPGQANIWTTKSDPGITNYATALGQLGSKSDILYSAFTGDYLAWQWINRTVPAGERIATLEDRTYYIERPQSFFYLDGTEASPLLHISNPAAILRFLRARGVRWVLVSEWDRYPGTQDPALKLLRMGRLLGGPDFPLRAVFSVNGLQWLTSIYAVGGARTRVAPAVFSGFTSPPPRRGVYIFEPNIGDNRMYVPGVDETAGATLSFRYRQAGGAFRLLYQPPGSSSWRLLVRRKANSTSPAAWHRVSVSLPPGVHRQLMLMMSVSGRSLQVENVQTE